MVTDNRIREAANRFMFKSTSLAVPNEYIARVAGGGNSGRQFGAAIHGRDGGGYHFLHRQVHGEHDPIRN
jgi:hypothetical protein